MHALRRLPAAAGRVLPAGDALYLCDNSGVVETVTMGDMLPSAFAATTYDMRMSERGRATIWSKGWTAWRRRRRMVLGSGLGGLVDQVEDAVRIPYADLPGFPGKRRHRPCRRGGRRAVSPACRC